MRSNVFFSFRSIFNFSSEEVFNWHLRQNSVKRAVPPNGNCSFFSSKGKPNSPKSNSLFRIKVFGLFWKNLTLTYRHYVPNESFTSIQTQGPFREFKCHTKTFKKSAQVCELVDQIEFSCKAPRCIRFLLEKICKKRVLRILRYKHEIIQNDLSVLAKYPFKKELKILISGSYGFIGQSLLDFLEFSGHKVWRLTRNCHKSETGQIFWDPQKDNYKASDFEGFDAVFHLAGENIGKGFWTKEKKKNILLSRKQGTESLVSILSLLKKPPKTVISASAIGIYGDGLGRTFTEHSRPNKKSFLATVCQAWEKPIQNCINPHIRSVVTRFGIVLGTGGGVLQKLLLPFQLGLGAQMGDGHQYMSWIAIDDLIGALYHILMTPSIRGPLNCVAPNPIQNALFSKKLAKRVGRWLLPPLPACFIHLIFGEKGEELLLKSCRVVPQRLIETGYSFHYAHLDQALEHIL